MANKPNPLLAAYEAKLEAQYKGRLSCNTEINMIAMLLAGSRLGFLGEKRADLLLEEQIAVKMEIADVLLKDAKDDPSLTYTKADLARSLKQILGADAWKRHQKLFALLHEYWEE